MKTDQTGKSARKTSFRVPVILPSLLLLIAFTFPSCSYDDADNGGNITVTEKSAQLVESDNTFGLELFQKINKADQNNGNLMVSPLSISLALGMTYNGAEGETKTAMEKAMKLNGLTAAEINKTYQTLISELKSLDKDVALEIADAIYYRNTFSVEQNFFTLNKTYYNAEVSPLDFASPSAVKTINDWVSEKTKGKIPNIIDQLKSSDVMVLLNAIYFNGLWKNKFSKDGTQMLPFYVKAGTTLNVATMKQENTIDYAINSLFSAIRLPYGSGQFSMVVLLPVQNKTSEDIIQSLTLTKWKEWMGSFTSTPNVIVSMPRFKFAFEADLNSILSDMGMTVAFAPGQANFRGISKSYDLYIDKVKHKTYIDVNETGTEAAAVTSVVIGVTSIPTGKTYFTVDKPFLFAITEKNTGAILFIGEVTKPDYN